MKKILAVFLSLLLSLSVSSEAFSAMAADFRKNEKSELEQFTQDVMKLIYSNESQERRFSVFSAFSDVSEAAISNEGEEKNGAKAAQEFKDAALSRVIVKSADKINTLSAIKVVDGYDDLHILQFETQQQADEAVEYYSNLKDVVYAEKDMIVSETSFSEQSVSNPMSDSTESVGITALQEYLKESETSYSGNITVAVLDTGIESTHEMFDGRLVPNNFNAVGGKNAEDDRGHGTHVAGIIIANSLENVKVKPYKVLNSKGDGSELEIMLGIEAAIADGVDVIHMSLGGKGESELMHDAVKKAYEKNIPVIVSAGNDFVNLSKTYYSPACFTECITVMSCGKDMVGVPSFSNYGGPCDIAAPGVNINSAYLNNSYKALSGTSMSAPFVTAAVTYIMLDNREASVADIENKIKDYSVPFGFKNKNATVESGKVGCLYMEFITRDIDKAPSPIFSTGTSDFTDSIRISLSCEDEDAVIYYHTSNMPEHYNRQYQYQEEIIIKSDASVSAWAFVKDMKISNIITEEYTRVFPDDESKYSISNTGEIKSYLADEEDVIIPKTINGIEVKQIGYAAFANKQMKSVIFPDTLEYIDDRAFDSCTQLEYVRADSVTSIGGAFINCVNLQTIDCDKLEHVGERAFYDCSSLKFFDFNNIKTIGTESFYNASGFYSIVSDELVEVGTGAFKGTNIAVFNAQNLSVLGESAFESCKSLKRVNIPKVTSILRWTFYGDEALTRIEADSVENIKGKSVFANCKSLSSVSFPNLKYIDYYNQDSGGSGFAGCTALEYFDAPNVIQIGISTFSGCTALKEVSFPEVERIGIKAFYKCTALEKVNLPKLQSMNLNAFYGCSSLSELEFPSLLNTRKTTDDTLSIKFLILDSATTIPALPNNSGVLLPSTVTKITAAVPENTVIYATKGSVAYNWAVDKGVTVKEINQQTAIVTDLPVKHAENSELVADVIGFNRTYQWYGNTEKNNTTGTAILGATDKRFNPDDYEYYPYYYCVVTSTDAGCEPVLIRTRAVIGLEERADYSEISDLIESIPFDLSLYTPESVSALNAAIEAVVYDLTPEYQDEVDRYARAIEAAVNALTYKPADFELYNDALKSALELDRNLYEDLTALDIALSVDVSDKNITEQVVVDSQTQAILNALAMLDYKSADYTEYVSAVSKANLIDRSLYADLSELNDALSVDVSGKKITQQKIVDEQTQAILNAIDALEYKSADYTEYVNAIIKAGLLDNSLYVDLTVLNDALSVDVNGKNITEQADVDAQTKAILDAIDALEYKPADLTEYNKAVEKANSVDRSLYVDLTQLDNALSVDMSQKNITEQAEVDAQTRAILEALEKLEVAYLSGDVNFDGKISVIDAKWVLQSIAGVKAFDEKERKAADYNKDGKVSVVDAKQILQAVAGVK